MRMDIMSVQPDQSFSVVVVQICKATRHLRHMEAEASVLRSCICTALLLYNTHAHLLPLSVTKGHPVNIIFNPETVEYELGVLMVRKCLQPQHSAYELRELTTRPPRPHSCQYIG